MVYGVAKTGSHVIGPSTLMYNSKSAHWPLGGTLKCSENFAICANLASKCELSKCMLFNIGGQAASAAWSPAFGDPQELRPMRGFHI